MQKYPKDNIKQDLPNIHDVGPVLRYLYRYVKEATIFQGDDDEDGDNIHMIFVEKDENSIQELISDIDHPEIQSCKDIYLDIADDLQKFPKLNEVVTLREDDALVTCYGDFMNYFYPKSDQTTAAGLR